MPNAYFQFKQFTIHQERCAMKVTTDSCLFGAWVAQEIKNEKLIFKNVLDAGTGTGLISLMIAQDNDVEIDAVEIDKEAAEQAKENVTISDWKNINTINADIRSFSPGKKYSFIVSNPPFYEAQLQSPDYNKNTAHHSQQLSLQQLLISIKNNLESDGWFYLLLPANREKELERSLDQNKLFPHKKIWMKPSFAKDPFRIMVAGKLTPAEKIQEYEITISKGNGEYTVEFIQLLKDYYLHL